MPTIRLSRFYDEIVLWAPAITVLILVSSETGFSRYLRYALPAFPYLYCIWPSQLANWRANDLLRPAVTVAGALVATIVSSMGIYPHELAYFNEFAGGPLHGDFHLLDSNIDWGQDLFRLKMWLDAHPEARPIRIAYFGALRPRHAGINVDTTETPPETTETALSGWSAVSVNRLHGYDSTRHPSEHRLAIRPKGRAGYSIRLYGPPDSLDPRTE